MKIISTLYGKLTLAFLLLIIFLGALLLHFSQSMSAQYSLEIMQRLNQSVAMYITDQQQLLKYGSVDEKAVDELTSRAMVLNPGLEIYILDKQGKIVSHRLPVGSVQLTDVSLEPINKFLSNDPRFPILGEDPRDPNMSNVFSVSPIMVDEEIYGYVYAIVGGQLYQSLSDEVVDSHSLRPGIQIMLGGLLVVAFIGAGLFFVLTRRLTALRARLDEFGVARIQQGSAQAEIIQSQMKLIKETSSKEISNQDEIDQIDMAFQNMAKHINQQFDAIQSMDETRRELIANVSHDLRTPLASMQGYIETLILKDQSLNDNQRNEYLHIAHKHSQRLAQLVSELFELAKLESKGIEPKMEPFSLLELAHDSVQEFQLLAQSKNIDLKIAGNEECYVAADIALIQRVLQNLIDNALRHTPAGGQVSVQVNRHDEFASVAVTDTGKGIQTREIPYIFDRFYRSKQQQPSEKIGTGLGLAIVKRILDLHQSSIDVKSQINKGTSFIFELPKYS